MSELGERLYRQIIEQSGIAIVYGDVEGVIRLWNKGAEEIFGWTAEEALGKSMDFIIPEKHRRAHAEGYRRVMTSGVTKYGRSMLAVPALTKGGQRISVEFSIVLLKEDGGTIAGAAAFISDVTQRWERDKALRKRLEAAEAKAGPMS
jgi:PAS domain S-box-containing protein